MSATTLKKTIREFNETQMKYRDFGALDTEPDGIFQSCLQRHYEGRDYHMPISAHDWDLYSTVKGAGNAARALTSKLKKCLTVLDRITIKEQKEVREMLESELWRVY